MTTKTLIWTTASVSLLAACSSGAADEPAAPAAGGDDTAASATYADGVYVGPRVTNIKGGYQAQVTIEGGVITAVDPVEAGTQDPESLQVNSFAVPELEARVLAAQSANVDEVSGASFTSPAYIESIAGALDEAQQ